MIVDSPLPPEPEATTLAKARPIPLAECQACGAWSQARPCSACGWVDLVTPTSAGVEPPPLRILFDLVLQHTDHLRLAGVTCHRLPWLAEDGALSRRLGDLLPDPRPADGDEAAWMQLLHTLEAGSAERITGLFETGHAPDRPLHGSLRVAVHAPGCDLGSLAGPRLAIVDFSEQMSRLGAQVSISDVTVDTSTLRFAMDAARRKGTLSVAPAIDLLVAGVRLVDDGDGGAVLSGTTDEVFCPVGRRSTIELPVPDAAATQRIAHLAANGLCKRLQVEVLVRGLDDPLRFDLPAEATSALPAPDAAGDLLLDLGVDHTRLLLRQGDRPDQWVRRFGPSATMLDMLGIVSEPDGICDVRAWVEAALPALAGWAASRHGCFLRDVVLGHEPAIGADAGEVDAVPPAVAKRHILGRARLVPEHHVLAEHARSLLRTLGTASQRSADRSRTRSDEISRAVAFNDAARDQRQRQVEQFEKATGVSRMFSELTGDPRYKKLALMQIPEELPPQPEWLTPLAEPPDRLSRAILVDIGGSSLDVAFLDDFALVDALSGSLTGPGGDAVSRAAGLWTGSDAASRAEATRAKSRLLTGDAQDGRVEAFAAATRLVYDAPFRLIAAAAGERWSGRAVAVLLSGGASIDPFVARLLAERLEEARIDAWIGWPDTLARALEHWRETRVVASGTECERFLHALAWAEPAGVDSRSDPFNLLDGMLNLLESKGVARV